MCLHTYNCSTNICFYYCSLLIKRIVSQFTILHLHNRPPDVEHCTVDVCLRVNVVAFRWHWCKQLSSCPDRKCRCSFIYNEGTQNLDSGRALSMALSRLDRSARLTIVCRKLELQMAQFRPPHHG